MGRVYERVKELARPTGQEDVLNVQPLPPRYALSGRQLIGVAVCALAIVGALFFFSGTSVPQQVVPPAEITPSAAGNSVADNSALQSTAPSAKELVVSVIGDVSRPGLHTLSPQARVADALSAAGVSQERFHEPRFHALNLAQQLQDGKQVYVPYPDEPIVALQSDADSVSAESGKININTASVEQLQTLSGVGQKTAEAIIAYRQSIGAFSSIDQLLEIKGIGAAKFAQIENQVTL
ncbi:helix-hairpin-helix domain-containing protein [Corynebacterium sp. sy039]|uniref:helix-hairpin-helix domain-containing protein n=1 Tax=Corynebacterium sp. sy039 TaxID=2599641 RepID=UPI0011B39D0F|nr:ComEA family DNA-binding protein [Corynebacterium sp. sy039]QDZ43062.1 ComEA family DNA-binding protein [Corynebacterium sp. sy039]